MSDITLRSSVRKKLLLIMVGTLLLVGAATFVTVLWIFDSASASSQRDLEEQIRKNLDDKGALLARSHAVALGPLVYDNAFGDVRQLVEETVERDSDIVYALFLSAEKKPWAYVSPTHPVTPGEAKDGDGWKELELNGFEERRREVDLFDQNIIEHSAPVQSGDEVLGTIRYGMSDRRLQDLLSRSRAEAAVQQARLVKTLGALGLGIFALGIILIIRAAARLTSPLSNLTQTARRIAQGERNHRARVASGDEVELLARAFNDMLDENEKQFVDLEEKTTQALEASRLKSEFLANMSHEIRTPMNGVLGMVRLIQREPLGGKARRFAETIEASARGLMTIINDILDFSKMEAGKYSLQYTAFDPRVVVAEVCELLSTRAAEQGVELVCRVAPTFPLRLKGDPDRFRQVLNNIVGNAVKFTEQGEIFVDLDFEMTPDDQVKAVLTVVDSGIGIPKASIPTLFDAFSQADGTMMRKHGGTGLGLTISARLVALMGGSIQVESTMGVGSKFTMDFLFDVEERAPESVSLDWTRGKRILVVEPSARWTRILTEHLESWGLECDREAQHDRGFLALRDALSSDRPYDVLILGLELKSEAATSFVRQVRSVPGLGKLPIIALTQLGTGATLSEVENELRAQVTKPLRVSELFNALQESFVQSSGMAHELKRKKAAKKIPRLPILVVDDNEINRIVAVEELEHRGFQADVACDGAEALEKIKAHRYLLVLMDCQMPIMDGYCATAKVREHERDTGRHTPIIALTAHAMAGERERVLTAGMDDYLSKPFRAESLLKIIRQHGIGQELAADEDDSSPKEAVNGPSDEPADSEESKVQTRDVEAMLSEGRSLSPKVIELTLKHMPTQLAELSEALAEGSADARSMAHKIKGGCLSLGAEKMAETAKNLEHDLAKDDFSHAGRYLERLQNQFSLLRLELKRLQKAEGREPRSSSKP